MAFSRRRTAVRPIEILALVAYGLSVALFLAAIMLSTRRHGLELLGAILLGAASVLTIVALVPRLSQGSQQD